MPDTTPSDHTDLARLDKLERTVRRLRRWLWVGLIIAIALISFALGRASANRQMMNNPSGGMMCGTAMFNSPARPHQQGSGNSDGPNMRGGDGNDRRGGDERGGDANNNPGRGSRNDGPQN